MQIFHIAEADRWVAAQLAGSYAQSTLGRTLEDEGFLHASREDQWQEVLDRYYSAVTKPLVLLVIDTDHLTSQWREEPVGNTTYPHIYGPLNPTAAVRTIPLPAPGSTRTFFQEYLGEASFRMFAAIGAMVLALVAAWVGERWYGDKGALGGLVIGLAVGTVFGVIAYRRRDRRLAQPSG